MLQASCGGLHDNLISISFSVCCSSSFHSVCLFDMSSSSLLSSQCAYTRTPWWQILCSKLSILWRRRCSHRFSMVSLKPHLSFSIDLSYSFQAIKPKNTQDQTTVDKGNLFYVSERDMTKQCTISKWSGPKYPASQWWELHVSLMLLHVLLSDAYNGPRNFIESEDIGWERSCVQCRPHFEASILHIHEIDR